MRHLILAIFVLGGVISSAMAAFPTTSQITPPELSAPSFQMSGMNDNGQTSTMFDLNAAYGNVASKTEKNFVICVKYIE